MYCALDTNLIEIQLQNYVYQRSNCAKLIVLQDGCDSVKDLISTGETTAQKLEMLKQKKNYLVKSQHNNSFHWTQIKFIAMKCNESA